jgi:hypothetical protein
MCIIDGAFYDHAGRVVNVTDTNICVFLCNDTDVERQMTIYANSVTLEAKSPPVAMILPVPVPVRASDDAEESHDVRMVDTSVDPEGERIFGVLEKMFGVERNPYVSNGEPVVKKTSMRSSLPVLRCGSYKYSVVPGVDDFARLDAALSGRPSEGVMALLRRQYATGFAFLVCKLGHGARYHPVAYTHPLMSVPVPADAAGAEGAVKTVKHLFVPTMHWHGTAEETHPEWDHLIYVLGGRVAQPEAAEAADKAFLGRGPTCSEEEAQRLRWVAPLCFGSRMRQQLPTAAMRCLEIRGKTHANRDIIIPVF